MGGAATLWAWVLSEKEGLLIVIVLIVVAIVIVTITINIFITVIISISISIVIIFNQLTLYPMIFPTNYNVIWLLLFFISITLKIFNLLIFVFNPINIFLILTNLRMQLLNIQTIIVSIYGIILFTWKNVIVQLLFLLQYIGIIVIIFIVIIVISISIVIVGDCCRIILIAIIQIFRLINTPQQPQRLTTTLNISIVIQTSTNIYITLTTHHPQQPPTTLPHPLQLLIKPSQCPSLTLLQLL